MLWKNYVIIFPIITHALFVGGKSYVGKESDSLMNEPGTADLSMAIDENINQAIDDYDRRLKYMDDQKNIGYSKNDR